MSRLRGTGRARLPILWLLAWVLLVRAAVSVPACPPPPPTATPQALKSTASDRGLLWRLTREGRSSFLYGTLHVGKPEWRRLGPRTTSALRQADVLALEIDPQGASPPPAEPRTVPALPQALQQRLQAAFDRACVPADSLAGLHPVWQLGLLSLLEARWLGMDPAFAQELLLAAQARQQGMTVVSLETVATQTQALVPDQPAAAHSLLAQGLQQLEDQSARRVLGRMARAWETGDLATLEAYEQWCECATDALDRAFMRRLNDERNPRLADGIEARHAAGQRVFAAVGALHMTGPQALPGLLRARGFKVERLVPER